MQHRPFRNRFLRIALPGLLAVAAASSAAAASPLPEGARAAIEALLQKQTNGLPGKVSFSTQAAALPPCDDFEAFLPKGATPRGRISVGLRCRGDKSWTRFVPTQVAVEGRYYVAARAIEAGESLGAADVAERSGDLGDLPRSVITEGAALQGMVATNRIAAGAPLRKESMRGVVVIQQGQTVQLVAQGAGFTISTEGKAMTRAEIGATVQAKTRDGRLLTGVASEDGQIRLSQ
ncbi:flagellar basal body P-ring formation chaperone FlgA [Variovorax saccharolyticus]|uniref:flagellar basal body P-ring formation chaperone FlgA n=1 Tax=Variovorax saccharolyticus TaxID=3053516 RepID=UPI002575D2C1|nr:MULTISPECIES: flagellar basal body P-ring formation chaperone FlgA [unclassified Variovorax]MDM0021344.1 flagellar basal body P-ring formation chaperone FlgA [Variovorax sp. J22R187]MDM0027353.1 flagellar basal body P-ring formation chaperone FlgA [Variovorax sp. J31P216]